MLRGENAALFNSDILMYRKLVLLLMVSKKGKRIISFYLSNPGGTIFISDGWA